MNITSEYIKREALQKEVKRLQGIPFSTPLIVNAIEKAPKADVVEVVRCKDCEHWIYWADEKRCICDLHCTHTIRDDYCSFGVRKEGAEE